KLFFQIKRRAPLLKKLHLESFPAIHLKKMDWMDFLLKFSGEISVLVLSLAVAGLNLFYFGGSSANKFQDQSLAAAFLNRHTSLNPKLAAQNSQVITVVDSGSLVPQAQAENFTGLDSVAAAENSNDGSDLVIGDESTILAPNPDSVSGLIAKQIKIYDTKE